MPVTFPLTSLTTRAECDEVLKSLTAELDAYQHRDNNFGYSNRQAGRAQEGRTDRLADVQADIDMYTDQLAAATLTDKKRRELTILLRKANDRKDNLGDAVAQRSGPATVLAAVDVAQNDAQVDVLQAAIDQVKDHKATLPA